jgi:putative membrane protein
MPADPPINAPEADCETAALVGQDGSIGWLCWPSPDSGVCFAALVGDPPSKEVRPLQTPKPMAGAITILSAIALAASAGPALAHGGDDITDKTAWSTWLLTPDIFVPMALAAGIYVAGAIRRRKVAAPVSWARHTLFFAGLGAIFLALQSPIDPIAERLFLVHQVQHLLLRMLGPMLLALSWPAGLLTAGLPRGVRRRVLAPVVSSGAVRGLFGFMGQPFVATLIFIAALYVWEVPRYHDFALRNEPVHYLMHVTMLFAGLVFWWRIFDRRSPKSIFDMNDAEPWWRGFAQPSPHGIRYGVRLTILWMVTLSNILLGAYTAMKTAVLYPAYDDLGRLFGYGGLKDEEIGGFIIWMPSSMMCLIAMLIVIHWMGLHETRLDLRRRALAGSNLAAVLYPTTGAELIALARPKNRAMALGFSIFVVSVFITAIMMGVLENPTGFYGQGDHAARPQRLTHVEASSSLR